MRLFTILASGTGLALLAFTGTTAFSQTRELATQGELLDRVVAIVNDGVVLNSDLDAEVAAVTERLKEQKLELPPQNVLRQQVLERLVLQEIQAQRADKAGVKVSDENVNAALQDVAKRNGMTLTQLPEALAAPGRRLRHLPRGNPHARSCCRCCASAMSCSTLRLPRARSTSSWRSSQRPLPRRDEYNVSHILIAVGQEATQAQLDAGGQTRAARSYERAKGGEDFAKLAVAYSNSQTALDGGALGWRKGTELPTFLTDVVAKLQAGRSQRAAAHAHRLSHRPLNEVRGVGAEGRDRSRCTCATS